MDTLQIDKELNINKSLLPFSWLYGLGVGIRNKLFDWGILSSEEFSVPVICIGNLSVGGTGKTPHTEYLIRLLSEKYKVAVLSRGYKRNTKGFIIANEKSSAASIGDEPYQMYIKFPHTIIAVDADRRRGIRKLLQFPSQQRPEVILLDDAFQHRYVKPSLSILLTDFNRLFYKDSLLPAGRLREPWKNNDRANMIICTKCPEGLKPIDYRLISKNMELYAYQDLFFSSFEYRDLISVFPESTKVKKENLERLKKASYAILLVVGIANPEGIIEYTENYTSELYTLIYPDHHQFTSKNVKEIIVDFQKIKNEKKIILTTEKDAVRLLNNNQIPEEIKAYFFYLPIEVIFQLNQENLFIQKIESHVKNFARNRIMA